MTISPELHQYETYLSTNNNIAVRKGPISSMGFNIIHERYALGTYLVHNMMWCQTRLSWWTCSPTHICQFGLQSTKPDIWNTKWHKCSLIYYLISKQLTEPLPQTKMKSEVYQLQYISLRNMTFILQITFGSKTLPRLNVYMNDLNGVAWRGMTPAFERLFPRRLQCLPNFPTPRIDLHTKRTDSCVNVSTNKTSLNPCCRELLHGDVETGPWISNHVHSFLWDMITEPPLNKISPGWVIMSIVLRANDKRG